MRVTDANLATLGDASNGAFSMQPLVGVPDGPLPPGPSFSLAYPNPSRNAVRFDFRLPAAAPVTVEVFDLAGRRVRTLARGVQTPGEHTLVWDEREAGGTRAADGIYFVRARAPGLEVVRRVVRID